MRVGEGAAATRSGVSARGRPFAAHLRAAGDEARGAVRASPTRAASGRRPPAVTGVAPEETRERAREAAVDARSPSASVASVGVASGRLAPPELQAVARTLPVAIETFGMRDGAPLSLSFGRSLDVELRAVPGGVELVVRAEPRLARAFAAGLGDLVASLGRRGVAVVRAEVRSRRGGPARPPFVDLPVPLR